MAVADALRKTYRTAPRKRSVRSVIPTAPAKPDNDIVASILQGAANRSTVSRPQPRPVELQAKTDKPEEEGFWDSVGQGLSDFVETPAIKTAIDILSVGTYASANTANEVIQGAKRVGRGDLGGVGQVAASGVVGLGKGLSAAAGNDNDAITYGEIMNNELGKVSEGDTAGAWTRGIAGFVGDVALDPLTYVTLGGAAAVKAGMRGAQATKVATKSKQKFGDKAQAAPIRYENARQAFAGEFKVARKDQKNQKADAKEWRKYKRNTKRFTSGEKAEWARENIDGLRPAVQNAVKADTNLIDDIIASGKVKDENVAHALEAPKIVEDAVIETNRITPDDMPVENAPAPAAINAVIDAETTQKVIRPKEPDFAVSPDARLSSVKPVTVEENLVEALADVRAEKVVPGKPTEVATKGEFDMAKFDQYVKKQSPHVEVMLANGKQLRWGQIKRDFLNPNVDQATKLSIIKAIDPEITEGFYKAVDSPQVDEVIENVVTSTGSLRDISKGIREGSIPLDNFAALAAAKGIDPADPKAVARAIDSVTKTPEFKETLKRMSKYNTGSRTGIVDPEKGISGHAVSAIPSERFSSADIIAAKTPATPEMSRAFLESRYTQVASDLANHSRGRELRLLADDVFLKAVDVQKTPAGPNRTKRGASTPDKPGQTGGGAKFERYWNTHANIEPIQHIVTEARKLAPKNPSLRDSIIMTTLRDVDARLRLAGIDSHLSNMALTTDKTVVRLSPSEVFELMPKSMRMKYLWGTGPKGAINEVLPHTVMDVAETLVRSITKLNADGTPDFSNAVQMALATLRGQFPMEAGTRMIRQNLDQKSIIKGWESLIVHVAKADAKPLIEGLRGAKTFPEKQNLIDEIAAKYGDEWNKASLQRMQSTVIDLVNAFTKGFREGKPSILSDLVATNMRNAAVFGGNVGSRIEEVAIAHSERILAALETGTAGDMLSELVVKPPFPFKAQNDKAIEAVRNDAQKVVQSQVADVPEVAHHTAAKKNVNAADKAHSPKQAAKVNKEAYQELPAKTAILEKPALTPQDAEDLLDISVREANIDAMYRMFGTQRYFNARAGMGRSFDTISGSAHAATHLMTGFHNILRSWASKGYSKEQLRVAFKTLQNPERMDAGLDPIAQEMARVMNIMFDPNKNNFLSRNSVGPAHFNKVLKSLKFEDDVMVPVDATPAQMNQAWMNWKVNDPMDFFSKVMRAMTKTAEDVSMGAAFSKNFGSATKLDGYVKPIDRSGKNEFMPLIDQDLYYPREIVDEIPFISRAMLESRSFAPGDKLHTFVTKVMDPLISMLKLTQTTMKPGHHVMSLTGDMWRNSLAGMGSSTKEYAQISRILHTNIGSIREFDEIERWANIKNVIHKTELGKNTNQRYETIRLGNKRVKVGHEELYALMEQRGVALPAHLGGIDVDELADFDQLGSAGNRAIDMVGKGTALVDRLANPNHGKYSINAFTAHRDTFGRGALFLHQMQAKRFSSIEEAADYAAGVVRKWAPTSADLGGFEAKYARRMFFYYTWIRGMIPRIIEGALTKPGVALVPSKAMYNMASANGLDPSTMGDPFPPEALLPTWYQERVLGPQWEAPDSKGGDDDLWGMNPTGPLMDVANSVGSGIKPADLVTGAAGGKFGATLLNMSTPWFKAPMELTTGRTLDGGVPIEDKTQYLQDMIGPVRVASRIAGKDFTSPAITEDGLELANRTNSKYRNGLGEDMGENAMHEMLNYLTGAQFTNYTSDQAENSVEFAQKEKKSMERKLDQRFGG